MAGRYRRRCNIRTSEKQGLWVLFQILTNWLGNYSSLWVSFCPSGNLPSCQNCCKALTKGELQSKAVGVCPLVFSVMCSHACDIFFPQLYRLLASSTPAIRKEVRIISPIVLMNCLVVNERATATKVNVW